MTSAEIGEFFKEFVFGRDPGIGTWLSKDRMHRIVADRLAKLPSEPLTKVQFNQLLVASQAASVSDGFFNFYWTEAPAHTYDVRSVEGFDQKTVDTNSPRIYSLGHLRWGLYRFYIDGLLYFGNVKAAFNSLRSMSAEELAAFFKAKVFDTAAISARGPSLALNDISRDDRYLISEMVCKTFGELPENLDAARQALRDAMAIHKRSGGGTISFREFLGKYLINSNKSNEEQFLLSYDDVANEKLDSDSALDKNFDFVAAKFVDARKRAVQNTEYYLSMVNDLDVYVATSMRTRANFRSMSDACNQIFKDARLSHLHLRYFDPTLSAAQGHEDKGLIECLMVKCAKVLVYCEGEKESYGKDAEAAMALSLGKPVIFYCDTGKKTGFYRDVHPLARLIDFRTGVAVGAMVSDNVEQVAEIISRIFENKMEYRLEHHPKRPGFLKLVEKLTSSVVRLQTDDELITRTFWNNYHNRAKESFVSLAAGKETERLH